MRLSWDGGRSHLGTGMGFHSVATIASPEFGRVTMVCVGATLVGSIRVTHEPGSKVRMEHMFERTTCCSGPPHVVADHTVYTHEPGSKVSKDHCHAVPAGSRKRTSPSTGRLRL